MADTYKLSYYNSTGLAEPIRFILSYGGAKWTDDRIEKDDWPALKESTPWGQLPILTINEEKKLAQSNTIVRYLAKKFGLVPKDEFLAAKCEELSDAFTDFRQEWTKLFYEKDEEKKVEIKKNLVENTVPKYFSKFEKSIIDNGEKWLLSEMTWVDLQFAHFIDLLVKTMGEDIFQNYPHLRKLKDLVFQVPQIAKYVASRPKTEM